ncbi:hypothetical protein ACICHK_32875 [Streptomyces sp. AHU1]|uniref:hypothetical protein n=1 Tax=Streptomyces sp. AHU1 TaxID=3377215 RepID=UPI0038783A9E
MRTRTAIATVFLLAFATACSGSGEAAKPGTSKAAGKSAAAKPGPSPSPKGPLAFGAPFTVTTDGATMATTVLRYEQGKFHSRRSADEEFGTTGYTWAVVEIKGCLKSGFAVVTRNTWALEYADGTRIKPSRVTYGDFPKPEYPRMATVNAGECVHGKTVFAVPANQRPERVLHTSEKFEKLETLAEWAVPKA